MNPRQAVERNRRQAEDAAATHQAVESALSTLMMGGKPRVTSKTARAVLLGSPWFLHGHSLKVVAKSVGAGVYELREEQ